MVSLDASCTAVGETTLVECRLRNDEETTKRVRVESRLDGPMWPPRESGVSAPGWDDDGVTVRVPANRTVGVGFAAAAPPAEPPAAVVDVEPLVDDRDEPTDFGEASPDGPSPDAARDAATVDDVVRSLSDPRPPRDGVPLGNGTADAEGTNRGEVDDGESDERNETAADTGDPSEVGGSDETAVDETGADETDVDDWLDRVERRVERLEGVAAAGTLPAATDAVADAGGLDGVRETVERTRTDRERLLALAARARTLAGRVEAADPPVETLERLS